MKILIAGIPEHTKNYEAALIRCRIPFEVTLSPEAFSSCDRLLLPGGGDIHPSWFHQEDQGSNPANPELDEAQFRLLRAFVQAGRPVLGICRGMQIINVFFGGDLCQDLPEKATHRFRGQDQVHPVFGTSGSLLGKLYPAPCLVNSAHHQGCQKIGNGLIVTQTAPDGVIEGLEHQILPVLAVQWHPERIHTLPNLPGIADGSRLIRYFALQM